MIIEFQCGTELELQELQDYTFLFYPDDEDDYDEDIGDVGAEFWNVNVDASDGGELCLRQCNVRSNYISENGCVYIPVHELCVGEVRYQNRPLPLERQMEVAKDVLAKVRLASPYAVVSGGAARAFLEQEQANDIDIFLDLPSYLSKIEMRSMLTKLLPEHSVSQISTSQYGAGGSTITGLRAAFRISVDGQEVQLLVVTDRPDEQYNKFPYSHTQVSWDGVNFTMHENFEVYLDFKVVIKNYHPEQASYEKKVQKLIKDKGWAVANSADEALSLSMERILMTA